MKDDDLNTTQDIELTALEAAPLLGAPVLTSSLPFLGSVRVRVTARIGEAQISVAELLEMKIGSALCLDRFVDQTIDLMVDQHVVARGSLVAVGDHFGVRLTEPPVMSARPDQP